jgi:hypothetical protein
MISIAARLGLPIADLLEMSDWFCFDQHSHPQAKSPTAVIYTVLNDIFCGGGHLNGFGGNPNTSFIGPSQGPEASS